MRIRKTIAYSQGSRRQYTGFGTQTMCPNQRKTDAKNCQLFNETFTAVVTTCFWKFNVRKNTHIESWITDPIYVCVYFSRLFLKIYVVCVK